MTAELQYERVRRVETDHWWFVALRELVIQTLVRRHPDGGRVLDAGCGTGRLLRELPPGFARTGVDVEADVLAVAGADASEIEFVEASLEQLPFADDSFDAVVSLDVVSDARLADPHAALEELRRVLRPGGSLILNLPAYEFLRSGHDVVAQTARRYTAGSATRLLADTGFRPLSVSYRVTALFPVAAARRLLTRGRAETDVGSVSPPLNTILTGIMRLENRTLTRVRLPFGLSVFAVATPAERIR